MTPQTYAIIGYSVLSIPFIILGIFIVKTVGWRGFLQTMMASMILVGFSLIGFIFLRLAGIVK